MQFYSGPLMHFLSGVDIGPIAVRGAQPAMSGRST
jgi:hypothetical protein